jgi:hypothetical protein
MTSWDSTNGHQTARGLPRLPTEFFNRRGRSSHRGPYGSVVAISIEGSKATPGIEDPLKLPAAGVHGFVVCLL